jgi:hypothetical protein
MIEMMIGSLLNNNMVESTESEHKRQEGKRLKEGTGPSVGGDVNKIGVELKFQKKPAYIEERKQVYDELFAAQQKKYEGIKDMSSSSDV